MLTLLGGLKKVSTTTVATNSLRFRSASPAYLSRTFAAQTNSSIFTFSAWIKRGAIGACTLFSASTNTSLGFNASDQINVTINGISAATSTAVFRDLCSWYHVVYVQNGASQTIYVNGLSVAIGTTSNSIFNTPITHQIGAINTTAFFEGCITEINFIDGQALTPDSFAYLSSATKEWSIVKYLGTYGNNGFYLKFADASAVTAAALGKDSCGNGNNWTPNGFSITAGVTYDSFVDVPANNYCTLNSLVGTGGELTFSKANLTINAPAKTGLSGWSGYGTIAVSSGKWYFEAKYTVSGTSTYYPGVGIALGGTAATGSGYIFYMSSAQLNNAGSITPYGTGFVNGDTIGVVFDLNAGTIEFSTNNVFHGVAVTGVNGLYIPYVQLYRLTSYASGFEFNFGQRPFSYSLPANALPLSSANLAAPIGNYFAISSKQYDGTGSALTVQSTSKNVTFKPDFVWIKANNATTDHSLYDSVRGATKDIASNLTAAETTQSTGLTSFDADGFSIGTLAKLNTIGVSYTALMWKSSGVITTNTSGTISSQINVNTATGFSIVKYTGTGVNATVGHGLGIAPKLIIVKNTSAITNWPVYHTVTGQANRLFLNTSDATAAAATFWNGTAPTTSVFSIGTSTETNGSTNSIIAYCFSEITGFSRFSSYTGNGSAEGPFVYCGFKPKFIMIKCNGSAGDWAMIDTTNNTFNASGVTSLADTSGVQGNALSLDIVSNGFKIRSATLNNTSSAVYIFAAFAEIPLKYALAR